MCGRKGGVGSLTTMEIVSSRFLDGPWCSSGISFSGLRAGVLFNCFRDMAFGNILRVRPKKRGLCLLRCGCSSKGKEGVGGLFIFLEHGVQLMNEIRGKLGEIQRGRIRGKH